MTVSSRCEALRSAAALGVFSEHTTPEQMLEIVKAKGPAMGKLLKAARIEPQ